MEPELEVPTGEVPTGEPGPRGHRGHSTPLTTYIQFVLIFGLMVMMVTINGNVNANTDQVSRGSAAQCQVLVDLGDDAAGQAACQDPAVKALIVQHTPTAGATSPGQVANRELLCAILVQLGGHSDKCSAS